MQRQSTLADVLWPRGVKCLCCEDLCDDPCGEAFLCTVCQRELRGMRLPEDRAGDGLVRSVFRYEGKAKRLVLALKMDCVADAAEVLAKYLAEEADALALPPDTVLTWVTMPERRFKQRGIDHGRLLCQAVAARLHLPACELIVRSGKASTQRGLSREARLRNLNGTMNCTQRINAPVLLVDDVLTTGATVSACAAALMQAGAPKVFAITATKAMYQSKE